MIANKLNVEVVFATTPKDLEEWDTYVLSCPNTSFFVTSSWLTSYEAFGMQTRFLLLRQEDKIIGGAALAIFKFGPVCWIQVPHGPAIGPHSADKLDYLLEAIEAFSIQLGAIFVQITPFESAFEEEQWMRRATLAELPYDPLLPRGANVGVTHEIIKRGFLAQEHSKLLPIPLEGQVVRLDVVDLLMTFRKGTRRDIKYTLQNSRTSTRKVASIGDLEIAYNILAENASHQGYILRPWESFKRAAWTGIQRKTSDVFIALYNDEPQAAVVIAYGGNRASYALGGTKRDTNDRFFPAHLLQYVAMNEAKQLGFLEYDLTAIMDGGVADFKRGFRPAYYRLIGHYTKVYKPRIFNLYKSIYPRLLRNRRGIAKAIMTIKYLKLGRK